jgi:hypothetical protein
MARSRHSDGGSILRMSKNVHAGTGDFGGPQFLDDFVTLP